MGDDLFSGCTSLTSVSIADGVTSISSYMFYGCTNLKYISIPNSVTSIGGEAFRDCTSLTSISIPDSVTDMGSYLFRGCTSLTSVSIADGVTSISYRMFYGCTNLKTINIPSSVTSIGGEAFRNCKGLTSITIPYGVKKIEYYTFYECTGLATITIPNSVESIENDAFRKTALTTINFTGTEKEWKEISINKSGNDLIYSATINYNYVPNTDQDDDATTNATKYSIYIDNEYFINTDENFRYIVAEKYTYYQLYIKNNETGEILTYGTDNMICESADDSIASVGPNGTMVINGVGGVKISLTQNGTVIDTMAVHGCIDNSRITNYSAIKDSELYAEGFAPNCRLKVFNYKSVFVADSTYEGGGYYKVTFDVYNDVPTIFSVASFNSNGEIVKQQLIAGYSADMLDEMHSAFTHFGDLLTGKLVSGESEMYQTKTSVTLEVPLGGYVDFLTLNNSEYMVYANVLSGIVVSAMETADAWVDFVNVASADLDFDEMKFAKEVVGVIVKKAHLTEDDVVKQVLKIVMEKDDYAALVTGIMGYLGDNGVTMADLFKILADCTISSIPQLKEAIAKGSVDAMLSAVPPARIIKELTDAFVSSLQYAIVIKDIASMSTSSNDFLIIVYPTTAPQAA